MRPWSKYHALGNDYLVVDASLWADWLHAPAIRRVCDRHLGIGADGVMVRESDEAPGRFRARILNPDGSEAEKSGNGLRIFARHLRDAGDVGLDAFEVSTPGGRVTCRVLSGGREVEVAMGDDRNRPVFLHGDSHADLGVAITVLDMLRKAGISQVSFQCSEPTEPEN